MKSPTLAFWQLIWMGPKLSALSYKNSTFLNASENRSPFVLLHLHTREIKLAVQCLCSSSASEAIWCWAGVWNSWLQWACLGLPSLSAPRPEVSIPRVSRHLYFPDSPPDPGGSLEPLPDSALAFPGPPRPSCFSLCCSFALPVPR